MHRLTVERSTFIAAQFLGDVWKPQVVSAAPIAIRNLHHIVQPYLKMKKTKQKQTTTKKPNELTLFDPANRYGGNATGTQILNTVRANPL